MDADDIGVSITDVRILGFLFQAALPGRSEVRTSRGTSGAGCRPARFDEGRAQSRPQEPSAWQPRSRYPGVGLSRMKLPHSGKGGYGE